MCFVRSEKSLFTPLTYRDRKRMKYMKYSWGKIVVRVISRLYFSIVENEDEMNAMFVAEFLVAIGKQIIINNC